MAIDPEQWELPKAVQPRADRYGFELDRALDAVLGLSATVPEDAFTAEALGTDRLGNGVLIRDDGLVLTIGYLVTEAEEVTLRAANGQAVPAHVLGVDSVTGFGLLQTLEPLDVDALPIGTSRDLKLGDTVIMAAGGRRGRAMEARLRHRQPFAGYWEYLLDDALFTAPAHPLWSGAALLNAQGQLVGLGSLQLEAQENGKTVPSNMSVPAELLPPILDDLSRGRPTGPARPWLGVLAQELEDAVVVVGTSKGGPASRAELRQGDLILAVAGEPVTDLTGFYLRLWSLGEPGVNVPLTLRRGGDTFDVTVRSGDRRQHLKRPRYH